MMIWYKGCCDIYNQDDREECATKEYGLDRDYTASEMKKKLHDLCFEFNISLDENDNVVPSNQTILCNDLTLLCNDL